MQRMRARFGYVWGLAGLLTVSLCAWNGTLAVFAQDDPAPAIPGPLNVPGVCVMESPGPGFAWKQERKVAHGGVQGRIYICSKAGSTEMMALMILETPIAGDAKRIALLKSQWNGLVASLESDGFQNFDGRKPSLTTPVNERVSFSVTATDPEERTRFIQAATVFGVRNVFHFQASADSQQDAARLIKTVNTLKEQTN